MVEALLRKYIFESIIPQYPGVYYVRYFNDLYLNYQYVQGFFYFDAPPKILTGAYYPKNLESWIKALAELRERVMVDW